jgi:hypothetical protein
VGYDDPVLNVLQGGVAPAVWVDHLGHLELVCGDTPAREYGRALIKQVKDD